MSSTNANITNAGGLVVFDQTSNGTYSGVISDGRQMEASTGPLLSGSLVKDDLTGASAGNVTLAAVQAYSGGTFIEAGTLTLGVANAIASSSGVDLGRVGGPPDADAHRPRPGHRNAGADSPTIPFKGLMDEAGNNTAVQLNNNTLTLNIASGGVFSFGGVIGGTGGLVMTGGGAEFLNGASTYTGATTVNGGLLSVNGSIASSSLTTVNAGGALGGNGFVGNTIRQWRHVGARQQYYRRIGTLTVTGNLAFTTAATNISSRSRRRLQIWPRFREQQISRELFRSFRLMAPTGSTSPIRSCPPEAAWAARSSIRWHCRTSSSVR